VWYTLLPSLFMLVTSVWMLIRLVGINLRQWPEKAPLVIAGVIILAMTAGIVILTIVRWLRMHEERQVIPDLREERPKADRG
jgi:uncharacterized integral membrane protein